MSAPGTRFDRIKRRQLHAAAVARHRRIYTHALPGVSLTNVARALYRALPWWLRLWLWFTGRAPR